VSRAGLRVGWRVGVVIGTVCGLGEGGAEGLDMSVGDGRSEFARERERGGSGRGSAAESAGLREWKKAWPRERRSAASVAG